jgi:hypothetical protein
MAEKLEKILKEIADIEAEEQPLLSDEDELFVKEKFGNA